MKEEKLQQKQAAVAEIKENLQNSQSVILVDYRGLTVEEVSRLRTRMREAGVLYKVIKNTMLTRAANELGIEGTEQLFKGPTAVAFGLNDAVAPAKILADFAKETKKTELKGGILDGQVIDAAKVKQLAELPSREVLLAKMLGSMNAPITGLVSVLSGVPRALVCALNAIAEKKGA